MHSKKLIIVLLFALLLPGAAYAKVVKSGTAPKHDRHAPIDVTSDTLEVFQQENRAVFTGHVVAIQGEIRLKSDVMTVFYRNKGNPDEPKIKDKSAKATPATPDDSSIKKIDAKGNVFLSTPQETASGETGTYEPDDHMIHLNNHVVLTRAKNVLKGDHLVYNLDSGQSELTSDGQPVKNAQTPDVKKGRIHALFVPGSDDKLKGNKAKDDSNSSKGDNVKDDKAKDDNMKDDNVKDDNVKEDNQ